MKHNSLNMHPGLHPNLPAASFGQLLLWLLVTVLLVGIVVWAMAGMRLHSAADSSKAVSPTWIVPRAERILDLAPVLMLSDRQIESVGSLNSQWMAKTGPLARELSLAEAAARERAKSVNGTGVESIRAMVAGVRPYSAVLADYGRLNAELWDTALRILTPGQRAKLTAFHLN